MTVYFTSDTHFGHKNIIEYCNRPFSSTEEMDREMIRRWNETVKPADTVWHLGDFAVWYGSHDVRKYFNALNGQKALIYGNHDPAHIYCSFEWWATYHGFHEISVDNYKITLCHYAMRVWNQSHRGALMLYGHTHNTLPGNSQSLDVGVDAWDYRPITLPQILERMATLSKYE